MDSRTRSGDGEEKMTTCTLGMLKPNIFKAGKVEAHTQTSIRGGDLLEKCRSESKHSEARLLAPVFYPQFYARGYFLLGG